MSEQGERYAHRLNAVARFIELRAPSAVMYFSAQTFLCTKYNDSKYRMAWDIFREAVLFDAAYFRESARIWFYVHIRRMSYEQAVDVVFGVDE